MYIIIIRAIYVAIFLGGFVSSADAAQSFRDTILRHLENDRTDEAVAALIEVPVPWIIKMVRADKAFETLWSHPDLAPIFDRQSFGLYQVELAKTEVEKNPRSYPPYVILTDTLRAAGQSAEAVTVGLRALQSLPKNDNNGAVWIWNEIVYAAVESGQFDVVERNAVTPIFNASAEAKRQVISQVINFANVFLDLGRNEDALRMVGSADGMSSIYGRGIVRQIRVCALHRMGQTEKAQDLLDGFSTTLEVAASRFSALLCVDRFDDAAQVAIQQLSDPDRRGAILTEFQNCTVNPYLPRAMVEDRAKLLQVRDRPEVRSAIDAVGVILDYSTPCGIGSTIN